MTRVLNLTKDLRESNDTENITRIGLSTTAFDLPVYHTKRSRCVVTVNVLGAAEYATLIDPRCEIDDVHG
jgi:hypothetical protein